MELWPAIDSERRALVAYLSGLPDDAWARPSLCAGWSVRDVVAHLIGVCETPTGAFIGGFVAHRFSIARFNAARLRRIPSGASNAQLVERLRSHVSARSHPPGPALIVLGEVVLHSEDIHRALDGYGAHPVEHLIAVAEFYQGTNLGIPGKRHAAGLRLQATDAPWSRGDGPAVCGPLAALLLAICGRTAALDDLSGAGVATLRGRLTA